MRRSKLVKQFPDAAPAIPLGRGKIACHLMWIGMVVPMACHFAKTSPWEEKFPACPTITRRRRNALSSSVNQNPESRSEIRRVHCRRVVDVRGNGGFIIACAPSGPTGKIYAPDEHSPELAAAFESGSIPILPPFLEGLIRKKPSTISKTKKLDAAPQSPPTTRKRNTHATSWTGVLRNFRMPPRAGRNTLLNNVAYRMGRLIGAGWIDKAAVVERLAPKLQELAVC